MKTFKDYLEETIRRYGAVGSSPGMGYTMGENAGVFNIGDRVTYKGQPAEVIDIDGTAATVYVPNWKSVPGMVDGNTEVDPASRFLTPIEKDVDEAAPGDTVDNAANNDPLLAKSVDLAPVSALEESAELKLILQRAKLVE